jgi:hypothetical protein
MKFLAVWFGIFVMIVGVVGVVAPSALLGAAEYSTTPIGLYVLAALRIGIGIVLLQVARSSRAPKVIRALGAIAVAAGVVTAFIGVDRGRAMVAWEIAQGTTLIRLGALIAVVFGGFIVFAVTSRRTA